MQLGNKIHHNVLTMGNKKNTGINLGNKINDQSRRIMLNIPNQPNVTSNSPIEKYHANKYHK